MKAEVFTLPKYPETNEDQYHIPDNPDSPYVLCDGASESYSSCLWAKILATGLKKGSDFTDSWLNERIREYESYIDAESLSWSKRLAYERGSFSTFLSVDLSNERCNVNAVGDSVAFLVNRNEVLACYPYDDEDSFLHKPVLLSTKPELNDKIDANIAECQFHGEFDTRGASHIIMLSDALAYWLMKNRDKPESVRKLLDMNDDDFREFVICERAEKRLRFDDTTMIRIELREESRHPPRYVTVFARPAGDSPVNLPSLEQYNEAVQNPRSAFYDPELQSGKVRKNGLGLPFAACGGFALTYNVTCGSGKYAVRCFHKESRDLEARYDAISKRLEALGSPYFVNFQFQRQGIRIQGSPFPIVKMAWADGVTIGEFIEDNFDNKDRMDDLQSSLRSLAGFLEANNIAHGDIQPGNIMVADAGRKVRLIDYDGMYLPELGSLGSTETGHRNFQHPLRARQMPWNSRLDRFSFILLFVVISALRQDPSLWRRFRSDSDHFLFSANDFSSSAASPVFMQLSAMPSIKECANRFANICSTELDYIPTLNAFINGAVIKGGVAVQTGSAASRYISTYAVLDAHDYDACLSHVGDMVELVGRIEDVKFGHTHYGAPYYFLNFSDWRGKAVKISVWSDYLKKGQTHDFNSLKGKHVSVIGLLQPPYTSSTYGYSHISVNLDAKTSFSVIDEKEATYRLNYETGKTGGKRSEKAGNPDEVIVACPSCSQKLRLPHDGCLLVSCKKCGSKFEYDHGTVKLLKETIRSSGSGSADQKSRKSNRGIFEDIRKSAEQPHKAMCPECGAGCTVNGSGKTNVICRYCQCVFMYDAVTSNYVILSESDHGNKYVDCPTCGHGHPLPVGLTGETKVRCDSCNREYVYSHYIGAFKEAQDTWKSVPSAPTVTNRQILNDIKKDTKRYASAAIPFSQNNQNANKTQQSSQAHLKQSNDNNWAPVLWAFLIAIVLICIISNSK